MTTETHPGRSRLDALFAELAITPRVVEHRAVFTVDDVLETPHGLPGEDTKNLFLKDAKGQLWLVHAAASSAGRSEIPAAGSRRQAPFRSPRRKRCGRRLACSPARSRRSRWSTTPPVRCGSRLRTLYAQ